MEMADILEVIYSEMTPPPPGANQAIWTTVESPPITPILLSSLRFIADAVSAHLRCTT